MQMQVRSVLRWQGDGRRRTQLAARRKGGVAARQGQSRITLGLAALRPAAAAAAAAAAATQQHRHGNLKAKEKQQIKGQKRGLLKAAEMAAAAVEAAQVPPHAGPRSKPRCCSCSGSRCRMDGKPGQWTISIPPAPPLPRQDADVMVPLHCPPPVKQVSAYRLSASALPGSVASCLCL